MIATQTLVCSVCAYVIANGDVFDRTRIGAAALYLDGDGPTPFPAADVCCGTCGEQNIDRQYIARPLL